jgi:hypothetical protein
MHAPLIGLDFAGHSDHYHCGETLTARYHIEHLDASDVTAVELSVLWHTEGKGDEDIGVHLFRRLSGPEHGKSGAFSTVLPKSPLSYEGVIVKVRWCVRARAFTGDGKELLHERRFFLGNVKAPQSSVVHEPAQIILY